MKEEIEFQIEEVILDEELRFHPATEETCLSTHESVCLRRRLKQSKIRIVLFPQNGTRDLANIVSILASLLTIGSIIFKVWG